MSCAEAIQLQPPTYTQHKEMGAARGRHVMVLHPIGSNNNNGPSQVYMSRVAEARGWRAWGPRPAQPTPTTQAGAATLWHTDLDIAGCS